MHANYNLRVCAPKLRFQKGVRRWILFFARPLQTQQYSAWNARWSKLKCTNFHTLRKCALSRHKYFHPDALLVAATVAELHSEDALRSFSQHSPHPKSLARRPSYATKYARVSNACALKVSRHTKRTTSLRFIGKAKEGNSCLDLPFRRNPWSYFIPYCQSGGQRGKSEELLKLTRFWFFSFSVGRCVVWWWFGDRFSFFLAVFLFNSFHPFRIGDVHPKTWTTDRSFLETGKGVH